MANDKPQDLRTFPTTRRVDPQLNPPAYVDEVLPTLSKKLFLPGRRGLARAPRGTVTGSFRISGSITGLANVPTAPGSFSLRITRMSVIGGSRQLDWGLWHSREGTLDVIHFETPGQVSRFGAPLEPLVAIGPGTLYWKFLGNPAGSIGTAYTMGAFMEGYVG